MRQQGAHHLVWGSGRGVARKLDPQVRLLTGVLLFAACVWAAPASAVCLLPAAAAVALWVAAAGMPRKLLAGVLVYGGLALAPLLLLPLVQAGPAFSASGAAVMPDASLRLWFLPVRSLLGMLAMVATATTLTPTDLHRSLARLPLPRLVVAIVVQIVHQGGLLVRETLRIVQAIRLRGGRRGHWTLLRALPAVWLPRMVARADRVGAAMELRAYGRHLPRFEPSAFRPTDWTVLAVAVGVLVVTVLGRMGGSL